MSGNMLSLLIDSNPYNRHSKYSSISETVFVFIIENREAFFSNLQTQKWNLLNLTRVQMFDSFRTFFALFFSLNTSDGGRRHKLSI